MTVVGITQGDRTYLDAVNRLLAMIGESEVATLMTPSRRVANAMRGVEDARDEIYYRTLWDFRRGFMSVPLVASTMWYELPVDYQEMAQFMSRNSNIAVIPYLSFDNMIQRWPELRMFPPGAGVGGIQSALQAADQTTNFGPSTFYTIWSGYLGLMPVPDADFVTLEGTLYGTYWKQAPALVGDQDLLGLPRQLWLAHHSLALASFKKYMEYPDWPADKQDGMRLLSEQLNLKGESQDTDIYHESNFDYNE
jgi:hypothetical protein